MAATNVIDRRLKIASASLKSYRRTGDIILSDFWEREVDRLLDAKLAAQAPQPPTEEGTDHGTGLLHRDRSAQGDPQRLS